MGTINTLPIKPGKWVGFDLDNTLALDDDGDTDSIGAPIASMVELAKSYIAKGVEVRIVTGRVWVPRDERWTPDLANECGRQRIMIMDWCEEHIGKRLPVTCEKDMKMAYLYDDRAITVKKNEGIIATEYVRG